MAAQFAFDVASVFGVGVAMHAQPHQLGDAVLGVEDGAAPRFGGVRGDHRGHQRAGQRVRHRRRVEICGVQLQVGGGQGAVLRRLARRDVDSAPPLPVDVLTNVGQQREVRERADDRDGLMDVDPVEYGGQLGAADLGSAYPKRFHPGPLDQVEDLLAVLLADCVAEDRTEQPDVFPHRFGRFRLHQRLLKHHLRLPARRQRAARRSGSRTAPCLVCSSRRTVRRRSRTRQNNGAHRRGSVVAGLPDGLD